jgi:hypothetical protein
VVDAGSGDVVRSVPRGRPVAWTDDGVYLVSSTRPDVARVWSPRTGMGRLRFDARGCDGNHVAVSVSVAAGWTSCRGGDVVAVSPSGQGFLRVTGARQWPSVLTQDGQPLGPRLSGTSSGAPLQKLEGAAFLDEDQVILNLAERTPDGVVSAFVQCSVADGACAAVSEVLPARQSARGAFLIVHECHEGGRGRAISQTSLPAPGSGLRPSAA